MPWSETPDGSFQTDKSRRKEKVPPRKKRTVAREGRWEWGRV